MYICRLFERNYCSYLILLCTWVTYTSPCTRILYYKLCFLSYSYFVTCTYFMNIIGTYVISKHIYCMLYDAQIFVHINIWYMW